MCGIVGYVGRNEAAPILLEGLSRLEYRGYDSAGICVEQNGVLEVAKAKGRLQNLIAKTDGGAKLPGLDLLIQEKTGIDVTVSENAEDCVAVGAGMALSVLADRSQNGARKQKRGLFGRK